MKVAELKTSVLRAAAAVRAAGGAVVAAVLCVLLLLSACGKDSEERKTPADADAILTVGDSTLTMTDVVTRIPAGLEEEDSIAMHQAIVRNWLEQMLLSEIAVENIDDLDRIEKMVSEYRKRLIIESYRRKLRESRTSDVATDSLREYYAAHREELVLDRPVVKGLFLKIPANAQRIGDIRRWMATATPSAIDNLERYGLNDAIKYSFFEDKWMDFQTIVEQIPYRFFDTDAFVEATPNFETTYGGITYILHISDFMKSGSEMPFEVAAPLIRETLQGQAGETYERKLLTSLYNRAVKSGKLKIENNYKLKIYSK